MSNSDIYLLTTLLVYTGVAMIASWGLNLQIGETNVLNFGFILFEAVGAYVTAILTLGPDTGNGGVQQYVFGAVLPFPVPWLVAMVVGAALGLVMGLLTVRRLRGDYEAVVMLVMAVVAYYAVSADTSLLNGSEGLSLIPAPFTGAVGGGPNTSMTYRWVYVAVVALVCVLAFIVVNRVTSAPLGRALRAVRDNDAVAMSLGKDATRLRILVQMVGGALGALAGAMLVQWVGAWAPGSWTYPETFTLFAAIIVGGTANIAGVGLGAVIVPGIILEGVIFLPTFGPSYLTPALQWILIGVLIVGFMWFRPQGIIPERRRRFPALAVPGTAGESNAVQLVDLEPRRS
ncbi:MAG: branched-chain amino acid ABC transporter permease [Actinomycetota bacterium]|nr:branched-chain amino acid ABC transporter permease [Actinomycetota bacterium]